MGLTRGDVLKNCLLSERLQVYYTRWFAHMMFLASILRQTAKRLWGLFPARLQFRQLGLRKAQNLSRLRWQLCVRMLFGMIWRSVVAVLQTDVKHELGGVRKERRLIVAFAVALSIFLTMGTVPVSVTGCSGSRR